jgi:hypothetical protein
MPGLSRRLLHCSPQPQLMQRPLVPPETQQLEKHHQRVPR